MCSSETQLTVCVFQMELIIAKDVFLQIEEEDYLIQELKKIEQRKKEREKKTQDLQKLITAADNSMEARRSDRKATKKKLLQTQRRETREVQYVPLELEGAKLPLCKGDEYIMY